MRVSLICLVLTALAGMTVCRNDGTDGDADSDGDVDGDVDGDSDGDADGDSDGDGVPIPAGSLGETYFDSLDELYNIWCDCWAEQHFDSRETCLRELPASGFQGFNLMGSLDEMYAQAVYLDELSIECIGGLYVAFQSGYDEAIECGIPVIEDYLECLRSSDCAGLMTCQEPLSHEEYWPCRDLGWSVEEENQDAWETTYMESGCEVDW